LFALFDQLKFNNPITNISWHICITSPVKEKKKKDSSQPRMENPKKLAMFNINHKRISLTFQGWHQTRPVASRETTQPQCHC
jgi:hypothetical protein